MYFDEDGDLAHEFYEEVRVSHHTRRTTMQRLYANLRPEVLMLNQYYFNSMTIDSMIVIVQIRILVWYISESIFAWFASFHGG